MSSQIKIQKPLSIVLLRGFLLYAWGLTELTVNSCFFDTPPRAYLINNKYIYTYFYMCVGEPAAFWGVNC